MIRRSDVTVSDSNGTPEGGVYITVKDDTGALATLYNDAGGLMANPFQSTAVTGVFTYNIADGDAGTFTEEFRITLGATPRTIEAVDLSVSSSAVRNVATRTALALLSTALPAYLTEVGREGLFVWSSANHSADIASDPNQGTFVAPASAPTGASGAWVRKFNGAHNAKWFGATGDGTTNDGAAVLAALAHLTAQAQAGFGYSSGAPELFFPFGQYFLGTNTLDLTTTIRLTGEGVGVIGGAATVLRWSAGATGIRVQRSNTSGAGAITGGTGTGGDGTILQGLYLKGGYAGTEGEFHGVHLRATATLRDVFIENFQGDGVYAKTALGGGVGLEGSASLTSLERVWVQGCRNGLYTNGADSNACNIIASSFAANRRWGVLESSFLGNTYTACHAASNGWGTAVTPTQVSYLGNRFAVVHGQEAGASTNAPPATATNNTWWLYMFAGAADPTNSIPTWTSGITVRSGGGYCSDNNNASNLFANCYCEGDQLCQFVTPTMVLNGIGMRREAYGGDLSVSSNRLKTGGQLDVAGAITSLASAGTSFGPTTGTAADSSFLLNTTNTLITHEFWSWSGGAQKDGQVATLRGNGLILGGLGQIRFDSLGVGTMATLTATALNLATGVALQNNGTPIINGSGVIQAAAMPAHTGDVTSAGGSLALSLSSATVVAKIAAQALAPASVAATGAITSSGTTGVGYATGAGGAVSQVTSRTTTVTLNKLSGAITLVSAAGSATFQSFSVANNLCAATDTVIVNQKSGTDKYQIFVTNVAATGFQITFATTGGTTTETPVFNFSVIKAVAA